MVSPTPSADEPTASHTASHADGSPDDDAAALTQAVRLAEQVLEVALGETSRAERRRSERLRRLLEHAGGREMLFELTDQVLRITEPHRSMQRLRSLVEAGLPRTVPIADRAGLRLAATASKVAPSIVSRLVHARLRNETRGVILPAEDPAFGAYVRKRCEDRFDLNINVLGEAILGDDEARRRLDTVTARARRPDVDYVSVKISALCANLDVLAFDESVDRIGERLREIYRAATAAQPPAFVNLDMEEYRDLHLTVAAFRTVLDEPEFATLRAGIVLQAYLPDSHAVLAELVAWSRQRCATGGAPPKIRFVKGANLAMEQVDAELAGWPLAPYESKAEVDASYKRLLETAVVAAADGVLSIGVGSHNLFDVAWALGLRRRHHLADRLEIEMLEGMAPAQARATRDAAGELLLYAPVVERSDFAASIAYLTRRLDENAGPENFLRSLFSLTPGSPLWRTEQDRFEQSVLDRHRVAITSRRTQDRSTERRRFDPEAPFANEPDTDFTQALNRAWISHHLTVNRPAEPTARIDTTDGIDTVVETSTEAAAQWADSSTDERRRLLCRIAEVMAARRGRTLAVMAHDAAKTVHEGDPEVSEAIDFARWAAESTRHLDELLDDGAGLEPYGVVVVAGPWNFPYAIPANGVLAALATGNAALLKPAPEAVGTAVELMEQLAEAGVPDGLVQLVVCPDNEVGRHLITHDDVDVVVLTGSYDTARMFLDWKPSLRLFAETSGKNGLVITAAADQDLAIKDLVRSAFGHAGQKCSAASLAILDVAVHDDPLFLTRLADAVRSIVVGPPTELATVMGPLIGEPSPQLSRALTTLDPGESWLVEPQLLDPAAHLWSPGVKLGVRAASWFHRTECFGPVLGIMTASSLDEAIELQNASEFGLTGGIQSLDPVEIDRWTSSVEVGNAYVNRHITGAIVGRQPFGGWKRSSVGAGAKAGGPGDIFRLLQVSARPAEEPDDTVRGDASYAHAWRRHFAVAADRFGLVSEDNVLRHVPIRRVLVRLGPDASPVQIGLAARAAALTGASVEFSAPVPVGSQRVTVVTETDAELAARLARSGSDRLRLLTAVDDEVRRAAHRCDITVDDSPLSTTGLVELGHWLDEQALSITRHRHGRVADQT